MRADYNYFRKLRDKFILFIRNPKRYPLKLDKITSKFIEEVLRMLYVKLKTDPNKKQYDKFIRAAVSPFDRFTDNLQDEIIRVVRIGNKNESTVKEMTTALNRTIDRNKHRANNLIETTIGGVNRAKRMEEALEAGFEYFRYTGPAPEREFCEIHYGKIYHIDEIRKMDNEQKLPVEYFCGGYRCKHTWTVVTKKKKEISGKVLSDIKTDRELTLWMETNVAYKVSLPRFSADQAENFKIAKSIAETIYNHRVKHNLPLLTELVEDTRYSSQNAYYSRTSDSIGIGKDVLKYMDIVYRKKLESQGVALKDAHSYFYSNNFEDICIHELGHRTHNYFRPEIDKVFNADFDKYLRECTERAKVEFYEPVQLAEMVAEYYSLRFHKAKIPNDLIQLFEGLKL